MIRLSFLHSCFIRIPTPISTLFPYTTLFRSGTNAPDTYDQGTIDQGTIDQGTIDQGTIDMGSNAVRVAAASVKKLDKIVAEHPDETLNVVRNWLHQET